MKKIRTLTGAGLTVRLDDQGGLVVEGLKSIDPRGADELRRYIRENKPEIVEELRALAEQAKSPGVEGAEIVTLEGAEDQKAMENANNGPVIQWLCTLDNGEPCPESAARDLIELDQRGFIKLDLSSDPPAFTLADGHGYGEGDQGFVQALIDEAGPALARMIPTAKPGADYCQPVGGWCKHYIPKQVPGEDQDAGLCEHPAIPRTPAIVTTTKSGKEKRRAAEGPERLDWIPSLEACPGRELIQTREARP